MKKSETPAPFRRIEDAYRDASMAAAMLAKHFEAQADSAGDDKKEMFAMLGFEGLADEVRKHLDTIMGAASEWNRVGPGGAR